MATTQPNQTTGEQRLKTTQSSPTTGTNSTISPTTNGGSTENLPAKTTDAKSERADSIIKRYALYGTATGIIPTFGLDVAALTAVQVKMIKDLSDVYDYNIDDQMIRTSITTGVTALIGRLATGLLSGLTKSILPLKFLIGGATQAALNGFLTAEIGKIYQARMSNGQNPADITVSEIVNHVISQIQEGKWNPTKVAGFRSNFNYLLDDKK